MHYPFSNLKNLAYSLYQQLLPNVCLLCGHFAKNSIDLCLDCKAELPWLPSGCVQCGKITYLTENISCGNCLKNPPYYDHTLALFYYKKPIDHLIIQLKFHHNLINAKLLGELMLEKIKKAYKNKTLPECIIPVPLHSLRLRERGFNQALEISRPISKKLGIPIVLNACQRTRHTEPQSALAANKRNKNIKDAFLIDPSFKKRHIAILDDVVTTGSTANELAKAFKKAGIERVDVWCCAHTFYF